MKALANNQTSALGAGGPQFESGRCDSANISSSKGLGPGEFCYPISRLVADLRTGGAK